MIFDKLLAGLGAPVNLAIEAYKVIKNWGFFWAILKNWGDLKIMSQRLAVIVERMKNEGMPSCDESKELIQMLRFLFEKKILDLPNVDEAVLVQALLEIEESWVCEVQDKRLMKGLKP